MDLVISWHLQLYLAQHWLYEETYKLEMELCLKKFIIYECT